MVCLTRADRAEDPGKRLRLTLGLEKNGGSWAVTHEHHSFTLAI
ncbi:MAG: nuclear transport factor 2 family protein [Solirubrobacterales bacterium]